MLKKFFRRLTQSSEDRFAADSDALADSLAKTAPQSAQILRQIATLMRRVENASGKQIEVDDLDGLALSICEALRDRVKILAKLEAELPLVIASCDGRRFDSHMDQWRKEAATITRAYSRLRHAITGQPPSALEQLGPEGETKLNAALESLELQIRTAERIQSELG